MILHDLFDDKNMKDIESRHNKALTSDCQLMLKKNDTYTCDEFFHFYMKIIRA